MNVQAILYMKNGVFWDVTASIIRVTRIGELGTERALVAGYG
jgi:hypothetical protein